MDLIDLRYQNTLFVYREIFYNNVDTLDDLAKITTISKNTVSEIVRGLISRNIVSYIRKPQSKAGRPFNYYRATNVYFSVYVELRDDYFSVIGITTGGKVTIRFDYPVNYLGNTVQDCFNEVIKEISQYPEYEYCMSIYLINMSKHSINAPKYVVSATREELITASLLNEEEISLIVINNKLILSIYSKIQYPECTEQELFKAIKVDKIYRFDGSLDEEMFDAISRVTILELEKIL